MSEEGWTDVTDRLRQRDPPTLDVEIRTEEIRGKRYGAGTVGVSIGGADLDAVAVVAGDAQYVCTEDACVLWLAEHGLDQDEARRLVQRLLDRERQARNPAPYDGHHCPNCGERTVEPSGEYEANPAATYEVGMGCDYCGWAWVAVYKIQGCYDLHGDAGDEA